MATLTYSKQSLQESSGHERPLLTHHVARILGIATRTVRQLAQDGLLKGFKQEDTPKIWRFWRKDVQEYQARREAQRLERRTVQARVAAAPHQHVATEAPERCEKRVEAWGFAAAKVVSVIALITGLLIIECGAIKRLWDVEFGLPPPALPGVYVPAPQQHNPAATTYVIRT